MPERGTVLPHEADHVRSLKHGGPTTLDNLCWACALCNSFKGSDIATYAPGTDELVPLFHPRTNAWDEHFFWVDAVLRGRTEVAAATIELLKINQSDRVEHRRMLIRLGLWT